MKNWYKPSIDELSTKATKAGIPGLGDDGTIWKNQKTGEELAGSGTIISGS